MVSFGSLSRYRILLSFASAISCDQLARDLGTDSLPISPCVSERVVLCVLPGFAVGGTYLAQSLIKAVCLSLEIIASLREK